MEISQGINYANRDTLATTDEAQLLAAGAETTTFAVSVRFLTITYVDQDCYIAKTSAKVSATSGGAADDRIFLKAASAGITLPWSGQDVYFLNAVATETPTLSVVGHA